MAEVTKNKLGYIFAVGRRKNAVARVRLYTDLKNVELEGEEAVKGGLYVNNKKIEDYFTDKVASSYYLEPLKSINALGKYVITIRVVGGGQAGQLGAVIHGMSRVLSVVEEKNRDILKKKGFLTRDARVRQRRNVGMGGKSRRAKQSPKR
ncbi:30S ribosomal protein S9 [Patescibacteria group bacterium]|nr:30S ribosomal protein S9 [Patescibacteria group bacterium]